ncbi:MAG: hypothetical protein IPK76_26665 [Lewinellaceae bacterium]|nr:hypothetical protein [Lewinellaceae bacterium]
MLFLNTEFGLYFSNDGGQNWVLYKSRFPEYVAVHDLVIQPATNDLVVGTHGRGIFIIDDISPLRRMTPELLERDVALLPTRPTAVTTGHYGQAFPNTDSYAGPNAPESAVIQYYLKDRLNTGDVTIEVYDPSGKLLVSMPGTKRKGINMVRWEMRVTPPKAAKGVLVQGEPGVYAGFVGQMALPGTYAIKLKAGDFTDEGRLVLVPDPLQPELDYSARRDVSDKLFRMVESLGLLVAQVQSLKDNADQRAKESKDKRLKNSLLQYSSNLESFRKTLTETIESSGITGEKQLRARIGRLYLFTEISDELPTQSILDAMVALQEELQNAQSKADTFFGKDLNTLNNGLKKEKLAPLVVIDRVQFEKDYGKVSAPGTGKGQDWRQMMESFDGTRD